MLTENATVNIEKTKTNLQQIHNSGNEELIHSSPKANFEEVHPCFEDQFETEIGELKNCSENHSLLGNNSLKEDESILFDDIPKMQPRVSADAEWEIRVPLIVEVKVEIKNHDVVGEYLPKVNSSGWNGDVYVLYDEMPKKYYEVKLFNCFGYIEAASNRTKWKRVGACCGKIIGTKTLVLVQSLYLTRMAVQI
jgi:hypothetical protein